MTGCNLFRHSLLSFLLSYSQPTFSAKMKFCSVVLFIVLALIIHGVEAHKVSTYGIKTVDNVCAGVGDLDQLADITSQLMAKKFPKMGSIRVSCLLNNK